MLDDMIPPTTNEAACLHAPTHAHACTVHAYLSGMIGVGGICVVLCSRSLVFGFVYLSPLCLFLFFYLGSSLVGGICKGDRRDTPSSRLLLQTMTCKRAKKARKETNSTRGRKRGEGERKRGGRLPAAGVVFGFCGMWCAFWWYAHE